MMGPDILHLSTSRKVEEICQQCFILFFFFLRERLIKRKKIKIGEMDLTCLHGSRIRSAYSRVLPETYLVSTGERTGKLPFLMGYGTLGD